VSLQITSPGSKEEKLFQESSGQQRRRKSDRPGRVDKEGRALNKEENPGEYTTAITEQSLRKIIDDHGKRPQRTTPVEGKGKKTTKRATQATMGKEEDRTSEKE